MTTSLGATLFCDNIGNTTSGLQCCNANDQTGSTCKTNFNNPKVGTFTGGCQSGNCLSDCQDVSIIYASETQDDAFQGNGKAPIRRYLTCANVPNMAGYLATNPPRTSLTAEIEKYIPRDASTDAALKNVTSAVTECLMATCRNARHKQHCDRPCAGVNLFLNSTTPNVQGINQCLNSLCTGGYDSLPYADADVVGIGVFASYIMQCMFVVLLCFGLMGFELSQRKSLKHDPTRIDTPDQPFEKTDSSDKGTPSTKRYIHRKNYEHLLSQFHKAQCYFSVTIQVASLSYGIFDTNMLITFLLIPLATNGILPVVFAYVLLRCRKASMDATLLTTACCVLASLVYWILYSHVIPINNQIHSETRRYRAYQQFMYKLSALQACGGYSALAVCPKNFDLGRDEISRASRNLRVLTPIIWSFSVFCLLVALGEKIRRWLLSRKYEAVSQSSGTEGSKTGEERSEAASIAGGAPSRSPFTHDVTYYLIVLCFLAGIGMQLSLLSVATSLHMTNKMQWTFGQIVAVTLWAPPLLGWFYDEIKEFMPSKIRYGSRTRQPSNV